MSILGAMYTAVSGLNAQSNAMGSISDNIANSQTTGYKKVDTRFQTLVTVSNAQTNQPGGVISTPFYANALQGSITQTQDNTNLALSGNGMYVVSKPTSQTATATSFNALNYYTRAGDFNVNRDGYLVNGSGYYLDGWPVDQTTAAPNTASLAPIQITQLVDQPSATTDVDFVGNLPANSTVNPTPALAPADIQIFDALGNPHTVSLVWAKRADNLWKLTIQTPCNTGATNPVGGTITGVNDQAMTAPAVTTANVAAGAQVDTVTPQAMAAGQTVTYTIGATPVIITAPAAGYTSAQATAALVSAINSDPTLSAEVTAGNIGTVGGTAQVDTVTTPALLLGQTISVTVNGTTVTHTAAVAETAAQASAAVQALLAGDPTIAVTGTAADLA